MYCRRCRECDIRFPPQMQFADCPGCGKTTSHVIGTVDEDWETRLAFEQAEVVFMDKEFDWRFEQLKSGGYLIDEALALASAKRVDLHQAIALRAKTDLAYQILI